MTSLTLLPFYYTIRQTYCQERTGDAYLPSLRPLCRAVILFGYPATFRTRDTHLSAVSPRPLCRSVAFLQRCFFTRCVVVIRPGLHMRKKYAILEKKVQNHPAFAGDPAETGPGRDIVPENHPARAGKGV